MSQRADIQKTLTLMARHGEIIEAAYYNDGIEISDEIRTACHALKAARVLTPRGGGMFGLSKLMRELIDSQTQRQRSYAVGGNLGEEIDRMEKLLSELEMSSNEGRTGDIDQHGDDLSQCLYEIQEVISQDILNFRQAMESNFSNVRNNDEKLRQNQHYLQRVASLQTALERLNGKDLHDRFASPLVEVAAPTYYSAIGEQLGTWTSDLLYIASVFEQYMFRFRKIARETRRLRGFARFLKESGSAGLENALEHGGDVPVLHRAASPAALAWPDFTTMEGRDALAKMMHDFKFTERRRVKERKLGTRKSRAPAEAVEDDASVEERALAVFLEKVDGEARWFSAAEWAQQQDDLRTTSFLEQVLTWAVSDRDCARQVRYLESRRPSRRRGNMEIRDIQVCSAA